MAGAPPTPRTTPILVGGLVQIQVGFDVSPMILSANLLVTAACTYDGVTADGAGLIVQPYTDGYVGSQMELIERWLSAHFYTVFDNQLTQAKAGPVGVGYQQKVSFGLSTSMYGQQAMVMDYGGGLAKINNAMLQKKKIRVGGIWLGCSRWPFFFDSDLVAADPGA